MTRFPTYPPDILSRADAFLASKYPDGIVDPLLVEVACEAMMVERERCKNIAENERANRLGYDDAFNTGGENSASLIEAAIRGTE